MDKTININDIYIAVIAKEVKVNNKKSKKYLKHFPVQIGLFVKTKEGYKHIFTDKIYPVSKSTAQGEYVLMKNVIYKLVDHNPVLASKLIKENKSELQILDIEAIESRYNNMLVEMLDVKVGEEDELEKE